MRGAYVDEDVVELSDDLFERWARRGVRLPAPRDQVLERRLCLLRDLWPLALVPRQHALTLSNNSS